MNSDAASTGVLMRHTTCAEFRALSRGRTRASDTVSPVFTSAAARAVRSGVKWLSVPRSSAAPQRPRFETRFARERARQIRKLPYRVRKRLETPRSVFGNPDLAQHLHRLRGKFTFLPPRAGQLQRDLAHAAREALM